MGVSDSTWWDNICVKFSISVGVEWKASLGQWERRPVHSSIAVEGLIESAYEFQWDQL